MSSYQSVFGTAYPTQRYMVLSEQQGIKNALLNSAVGYWFLRE